MMRIQSPGISDASLIDYDSNHSVTAKIDELIAKNSYAVCSTAGDTAAKTVTLSNFALGDDVQVVVKFANTNTASSPTLNINSTGAKPIKVNGEAVGLSVIKANSVFLFAYDGTNYNIVGGVGGSDMFVGTMAEWNALTTAEKNEWDGKPVVITDDTSDDGGSGELIYGCYEESPTLYTHEVGDIIKYNNTYYKIKIDSFRTTGVTIVTTGANANVELAGLPVNTGVWLDGIPGADGDGNGLFFVDNEGYISIDYDAM